MNHFNWDDARLFLALARQGTLTAAASELELGIATLSRRIERLESALNTPLFIRSQTGYKLTEEGEELLESAEHMEDAILSFRSQASKQSELSGTVKLATAESLASVLILPNLPQFRAQFPSLDIDLITDIRTSNLHRRDADLALRMVRPTQGNVSFRRIGTLGYGLYTGENTPEGSHLDQEQTYIGWNEHYQNLPAAQWLARLLNGKPPAITTTSVGTQVAACQAGLGLAVLPHIVAQHVGLRCLQTLSDVEQAIYLVIHSDLAQSKRVRAVADFLSDLVEKHEMALRTST
ncbi:LysR family transcriptional regulator [Marinomonas mediterranea]|uniref:LysR family transcriptional regulator n=1 Tax=Marinomonas mediterranea TaxID=119864 RepID=UPI00234A43E3|nr:LysR family transcriptional regulator [Marinomonas mediterranea]WCN07501.1 LysR family transcriptional regulator [Marinomonas mediterranea]